MRTQHSLSTLAALGLSLTGVAAEVETGKLGNATVTTDNPVGKVYRAILPDVAFTKSSFPKGNNVEGSISVVSGPNGTGVVFSVSFSNLPKEGGPFIYHIHDQPVPEDGDCTKTLAHLDPFIRGEETPCNASLPQTCQVGDLSGKFGNITSDPYRKVYVDYFTSVNEGPGSFFGNRSFVFHFANKTRISCANFELVSTAQPSSGGNSSGGNSSGGNSSGGSTPQSSPSQGSPAQSSSLTNNPTTVIGAAGQLKAMAISAIIGAGATSLVIVLVSGML